MINIENMSVLIVDDMEPMCKSIRSMLKVLRFGNKYRFAYNGSDALKIIREVPVGLIISDWNMPVMSGLEMLNHIREDKKLRDIPVVMVTAEANREIVAEAAESNIDAYILKPLTVKSLGDRITAVIEKTNHPPPMDQHLKKARLLKENGELEAAIMETKRAVCADRQSSKPLRELGYLYYDSNDMRSAEKYLIKAVKMNDMDVLSFHLLGEIYLKRNNINKASYCFEKAMKISPRHISRGVYFGKALIRKEMFSRAETVFDKAVDLSDNDTKLMENIVSYCMAQRAYKYAIKLSHELIKADPDRIDIIGRLAEAYDHIEDPHNAIKYYLVAEKKDKTNVDLKLQLARVYMKTGQSLRADRVLREILKLDSRNAQGKELLKKNV